MQLGDVGLTRSDLDINANLTAVYFDLYYSTVNESILL